MHKKRKAKKGHSLAVMDDVPRRQRQQGGMQTANGTVGRLYREFTARLDKHARSNAAESLTLAEEARQTANHDHSTWSQTTKLRNMPVLFISAGFYVHMKMPQHHDMGKALHEDHLDRDAEERCSTPRSSKSSQSLQDTMDEAGANADASHGSCNIQDPETSNSDDEVILFKVRINMNRPDTDVINLRNIHEEICAVEREIGKPAMGATQHAPRNEKKTRKKTRGRRDAKLQEAKFTEAAEEEDEMLADYIANMRESGEMVDLSGMQELVQPLNNNKAQTQNDKAQLTESDETSSQDKKEAFVTAMARAQRPLGPHFANRIVSQNPRRARGKAGKRKLDLKGADIDIETECQLQAALKNDRFRKAEQKRQREQLRASGMLGKDGATVGMSIEQVADELKAFFLSSEDSLCLPPMDKRLRKTIHKLANRFNFKSKSVGKADRRRPTLIRTKRTLRVDQESIEQAIGQAFYGKKVKNGYAEVEYSDGEVVGASAPELGINNRGRAMLEKMGWSTGTALGSKNNKGILQPVTLTMKNSRTGLG